MTRSKQQTNRKKKKSIHMYNSISGILCKIRNIKIKKKGEEDGLFVLNDGIISNLKGKLQKTN